MANVVAKIENYKKNVEIEVHEAKHGLILHRTYLDSGKMESGYLTAQEERFVRHYILGEVVESADLSHP